MKEMHNFYSCENEILNSKLDRDEEKLIAYYKINLNELQKI